MNGSSGDGGPLLSSLPPPSYGSASSAVVFAPGFGRASQRSAASEADESCAADSVAARVRNLPDLTSRLMEAGIYAEYKAYRQRYHQWRRGEAKGAVGELTAASLQDSNDPRAFEYWYPTASIFRWRYTMAYWKSILFLLGSLLFTFDAGIAYFDPPGGGRLTRTVPNLIGAILFSVGTYIGYAQLINIATRAEERCTYVVPDCQGMLDKNCQLSSIVGTVAYMIGAWVFNVGSVGDVMVSMPQAWRFVTVDVSNVAGSVGFVLGGLCELSHNRVLTGGTSWRDCVWWCSMLNMLGGVNFLAASLPPLLSEPGRGCNTVAFISLNYMVGSAAFVASSIFMVLMWQANDFGLTLIGQLNFAVWSGGQVGRGGPSLFRCGSAAGPAGQISEESPASGEAIRQRRRNWSLRPTLFILVYCWFAFVAMANCMFREQRFALAEEQAWTEMILDLMMQFFVVIVIFLVLVIHSVVSEVPDEEPYFCALVTLRGLLLSGASVQTVWFVLFWTGAGSGRSLWRFPPPPKLP